MLLLSSHCNIKVLYQNRTGEYLLLYIVPTRELVVVPVEDDLALGVAHPVQDVEGGEAEREHQPRDSVNPASGSCQAVEVVT